MIMHALIEIGVRVLEVLFGFGLIVSLIAVIMGLIDDIKTFIQY